MEYEFFATSSSSMDVYIVTVSEKTGKLVMTCNCDAGKKGILCRHRLALITNKTRGVFSHPRKNDPQQLKDAVNLISQYGIDKKYSELLAMQENLEQQWLTLRSEIKTAINELVEPKG